MISWPCIYSNEKHDCTTKRMTAMPIPSTDTIEIVCATDANYAPHTAVLIRSLHDTNPKAAFRVHILSDNVDQTTRQKVEHDCAPVPIVWKEIKDHDVLDFQPLLQISRATYLRLMMLEVLDPSIKRILYLDVDMVVNGDITPLWQTDLGDNLIGAVADPGMDVESFTAKHNLDFNGQRYFNAGMILMDLDRIRQTNLMKESIALLSQSNSNFEYADQCALNTVFWDKWKSLDPKWNFQRKFMYDDIKVKHPALTNIQTPRIIHFTEEYKPWRQDEWHPYAWLYLKYLMQTSFKKDVMKKGQITYLTALKWWLKWTLKT